MRLELAPAKHPSMSNATLTIDLDAIAANWRALAALSGAAAQTGAVVKADAYGLGVAPVAKRLADTGATRFFVALASEGVELRKILGPDAEINIFSGHMQGDTDLILRHKLTPILNSPEQLLRHQEMGKLHPFGIQIDTGMGRLGMQPLDWLALNHEQLRPSLVMSHLACSDEPGHPMNAQQLSVFKELTDGLGYQRSLSATGGILLGPDYHFDLTRPGIGLYGGLPFEGGRPVVELSLPVVQIRNLQPGDTVGYGNTWAARKVTKIATVAAGYADGLLRSLSNKGQLFAAGTACPIVGRVSMDLITVDVSHLDHTPDTLEILCKQQNIDQLATLGGTIGYEILTSLGPRYKRRYKTA